MPGSSLEILPVVEFAAFLGRSPDTARAEDLRRFQLHLASSGAGHAEDQCHLSALRFFFNVTLGRADLARPLATLVALPEIRTEEAGVVGYLDTIVHDLHHPQLFLSPRKEG